MKAINFGFTDTPISGVSSLNLPRSLTNFGADFRIKTDTADEVRLTNLTSPRERQENVRLAYKVKKDIYRNTGIAPANQSPSVTGVSLLAQHTLIASVTDAEVPGYRVDLPLSAHIVLDIPSVEEITEDHVLMLVGRLMSDLFDTGSTSNTRLKALLRGSLQPSDI